MPAVRAEPYDFVFQPEHVAQGGIRLGRQLQAIPFVQSE